MHPFQMVLLALVVAVIAFAVWMAASSSISERRAKQKAINAASGTGLSDPATCDHYWEQYDSGTCTPSYSSYGGPDPQETWTVESCALCGKKSFSCTGTCDCYSECAARYEED